MNTVKNSTWVRPLTCKSARNNGCTKTGLFNHFTHGCPGDTGRDKLNLTVTLLESMDVTLEEGQGAGHGGVGCDCGLCGALKIKEDDWIIEK